MDTMHKLLLVDDEPWALYGLKSSLEWAKQHFEKIFLTSSALEARDILFAERPNIVFSDIRMPDLSGLDLLRLSKENGLKAEFVFVSGFSDFSYARDALNHGANFYLLKPINNDEIRKVVNSILNKVSQKPAAYINAPALPLLPGGYVNKSFLKLLEYINEHYEDDISLTLLSRRFFLNNTYISDLFKKYMECSFSRYLTKLRLEHACFLLSNTSLSIKEVTQKCGYREYYNFVRVFKQEYGITPSLFRSIH